MKKRYILMAVTAALVFAVAAGGTLAANQVESIDDVSTPLAAQTLTVGLNDDKADLQVSPGDTLTVEDHPEIRFSVKNTGNIDSFVRVTITKYWKAADGSILSAENVDVDYGADPACWMQPAAGSTLLQDPDTEVFYAIQPLKAGASAVDDLLNSITINGETTNNTYANAVLYVEAVADGVQYAAGYDDVNENAILGSWGVKATVENGQLTAVALPN